MKRMPVKRLLKETGTKMLWTLQDVRDGIARSRPPLVPPRMMDHNHSFKGGEELVGMLKKHAGLLPTDRVLDVGCGIGRVAAPLTEYLNASGSYVGVDIVKPAVDWMQNAYAKDHKNFTFYHLDVHNSAYNPSGKQAADQVVFPFPGDSQFDVIFLISVFTHMYPEHIRHYIKLFEQQLKPGGRLFASMFINDEFAEAQQVKALETEQKIVTRKFVRKTEDYYAPAKSNPEAAAAYDPEQIARLFAGSKLKVEQSFVYGSWCGRDGGSSFYQDVVIAEK